MAHNDFNQKNNQNSSAKLTRLYHNFHYVLFECKQIIIER